jgi:hypothetical protein
MPPSHVFAIALPASLLMFGVHSAENDMQSFSYDHFAVTVLFIVAFFPRRVTCRSTMQGFAASNSFRSNASDSGPPSFLHSQLAHSPPMYMPLESTLVEHQLSW